MKKILENVYVSDNDFLESDDISYYASWKDDVPDKICRRMPAPVANFWDGRSPYERQGYALVKFKGEWKIAMRTELSPTGHICHRDNFECHLKHIVSIASKEEYSKGIFLLSDINHEQEWPPQHIRVWYLLHDEELEKIDDYEYSHKLSADLYGLPCKTCERNPDAYGIRPALKYIERVSKKPESEFSIFDFSVGEGKMLIKELRSYLESSDTPEEIKEACNELIPKIEKLVIKARELTEKNEKEKRERYHRSIFGFKE